MRTDHLRAPRGSDILLEGGQVSGVVAGAALSLYEISQDPKRVDRLLSNMELCRRLFQAMEAAQEYANEAYD